MNEDKKGFRRKFNWRIFLLIALYMFIATLAVGCVWNLITKDPVSPLLTTSALLHRAFEAIIAGLLISFLVISIKK